MFNRVYQLITQTYREAHAEQRQWVLDRDGGKWDWEPIVVLLGAMFALTIRHYGLGSGGLWTTLSRLIPGSAGDSILAWSRAMENRELARLAAWIAYQTAAFLCVPLACCALLRKRPADYALKLRGAAAGWPYYAAMYGCLLPLILLFSRTSMFQHTYPFYHLRPEESVWPRFIVWELLYAWQFIVLEFFFRGFVLHGLRKPLGYYSVFVMTVPYCMIHFGKPIPETIGSILAGIALGTMSLRTRSIWMGAALHIAVAWSMDLAALAASGRFR